MYGRKFLKKKIIIITLKRVFKYHSVYSKKKKKLTNRRHILTVRRSYDLYFGLVFFFSPTIKYFAPCAKCVKSDTTCRRREISRKHLFLRQIRFTRCDEIFFCQRVTNLLFRINYGFIRPAFHTVHRVAKYSFFFYKNTKHVFFVSNSIL